MWDGNYRRVAGGMSAATRLRRLDEDHEVVVSNAAITSPTPTAGSRTISEAS